MLKRIFCLLAVLMMLLPAAQAEEPGAFPVLNEDGFLDVGEYVYINGEAGVWRYVDDQLKVEIYRRTGKTDKNKNLTWYEAEVWSRGDETWRMFSNVEGKHMSYVTATRGSLGVDAYVNLHDPDGAAAPIERKLGILGRYTHFSER